MFYARFPIHQGLFALLRQFLTACVNVIGGAFALIVIACEITASIVAQLVAWSIIGIMAWGLLALTFHIIGGIL